MAKEKNKTEIPYECQHLVVALIELNDGALAVHCGDCLYVRILDDKEEKEFRELNEKAKKELEKEKRG